MLTTSPPQKLQEIFWLFAPIRGILERYVTGTCRGLVRLRQTVLAAARP